MASVPASSMYSADLGKAPAHMHLKLKTEMNAVVFSVQVGVALRLTHIIWGGSAVAQW